MHNTERLTKRIHYITLSAVLLLLSYSAFAVPTIETTQVDSLRRALATAEEDTTALRLQVEIADNLIFTNPDSSKVYSLQAMNLAEELADTVRLAKVHNLLAIHSYIQSRYVEAIESFQKSYQLSLSCGDRLGANRAINNIGVMYATLENHEQSIKNYKKSFALSQEIEDWETSALSLFNISSGYLSLGKYDSSWHYLNQLEAFQRKYETNQLYSSLKAALYLDTGNIDSAKFYADQGMRELDEADEQDLLVKSNLLLTHAEICKQKENYPEALQCVRKAENLARELNYSEVLLFALEMKSEVHKLRGDFQKAYDFQEEYLTLKDSLDKDNNANRINELNARYEKEKRDKEYAEIQADLVEQESHEKQKDTLYMSIGIFILAVIAFLIFNLRRKKRMNSLLNNQNKEIRTQRQKILSSIDYAKKIQRSILVPENIIRRHLPQSFVYLRPKDIVSGDFYWFQTYHNKVLLSTIDCTGHGVPGAFMSLIAHNMMNKVVRDMKSPDPSEILGNVHKQVVAALNQEGKGDNAQDGMDMSLCVIDQEARTIQFAGSQNPIFLVRDGELIEYKGDSLYLGGSFASRLNGSFRFQTQEIHYESGDALFMFTDGYMDQFGGPKNKKLNKKRFKEIIQTCARESIEKTTDVLAAALEQWKGRNAQLDDILVIGTRLD